ncbi:MAG: helix-turn-helix domain-containing protein [Ruminococcus sp.]|nr:helix-turn-helix domain-containing protein [Ruminococcus sp.]
MLRNITLSQAYEIMFTSYADVVTVKELAQMLRISRKKAYELIHTGKIPVISCGNLFKIAKLNVIEYLLKLQDLS